MSDLSGTPVLVTGADGFIGSHLAERLVAEGADVRAFCMYNSQGSMGWLDESPADVLPAVDVRLGDIRDPEFVAEAVKGVEIVFHLAALIAIPYSYLAPRSFLDTNVGGTLNVLEAVRGNGTPRMIHTSTSEVYGTPESLPITEDHPLRGQSPYSASKIGADKMCEAFACSFETPVVVVRPFNTYGPRQSARAVIPTILQQLLAGAEEVRLGNVSPRRDFTFVADTVDGFVKAATVAMEAGEVVQLGTGTTISIEDLFHLCCKVAGSSARIAHDHERRRPDDSEVEVLMSDPSRASDILGWAPTVELEDGLRRTAEWLSSRVDRRRAGLYQR